MSDININKLDWNRMNGVLPVVVQHARNGVVLMLGYMNREALIATLTSGQLTLYIQEQDRLWRKGEVSGNSLAIEHISADDDNDSLLVQVLPKEKNATCHFLPMFSTSLGLLDTLVEDIAKEADKPPKQSSVAALIDGGLDACAQSLGEHTVTTIIAATKTDEELLAASAKLLLSFLIFLQASPFNLYAVLAFLQTRE